MLPYTHVQYIAFLVSFLRHWVGRILPWNPSSSPGAKAQEGVACAAIEEATPIGNSRRW